MTILVGGVGQLYQGDLDLGRLAAERLATGDLGPHVTVEDLHYGAVAVAQLLEETRPETAILIGATQRDRTPGSIERRVVSPEPADVDVVQRAVGDAITGYVDVELVVEVGRGFGVLPSRTVVFEVEPKSTQPSEALSSVAEDALGRLVITVREEVRRTPLFVVAARIRETLADGHLGPSPTLDAMHDALHAVDLLDREGRWGRTSSARDGLRIAIGEGRTSEGMTHLDWGLWWGLLEEVGRLEQAEAVLAG